jgi:hypothetical protein
MPKGGAVREVVIDNRKYSPTNDGEFSYMESGFTNETSPTGDAGEHTNQSRKLGGFSGPLSVSSEDVRALQASANKGGPVPCYVTWANGSTWGGQLTIQGEVTPNSNGQVEIDCKGASFRPI